MSRPENSLVISHRALHLDGWMDGDDNDDDDDDDDDDEDADVEQPNKVRG